MKKYKFTLLLILGFLAFSCDLEEEPPFLANENVYGTANDASAALTGMYQSVADFSYYGSQFVALANLNSGFGVTKRGGNRNNNIENSTMCSLKPTSNTTQNINSWGAIYKSIGRTNDAIKSAKVTENPITNDEIVINDVVGQAYFIRAFNYFNVVRMWGEVPLRLEPTTKETVHLAKSSEKEIYTQIIADVKMALKLMNGSVGGISVKPEAANMLLAKVYMTLATAPTELQEPGTNYWQMAYIEAIKVYGAYSLVGDYSSLFNGIEGNNTEESIFELQYAEGASSDHVRAFTPSNFTPDATFGWLQANYEVHDLHVDAYPGDTRLATTYISTFIQQRGGGKGKTYKTYPVDPNRGNFAKGFPVVLKLGSKDQANGNREHSNNFKIYRYADLLLMLSEISNELQNGQEMGYVTEVLARVGLTPHAGYSGGQEAFRSAIMKEYQFELFFEAQDWFNNRRRGHDYFLNNVVIPHNTAPLFKSNVDVTLETNESIMHLPMPQIEIDGNQLIND